jgi:peptidoglycan/LPS O-acetylase OafA/YrhL
VSRELSLYLDVMRLVAAVMVFSSHMSDATRSLFWHLGGHASEAVIVFFVLSGFVIAFISHSRETSAPAYAVARLSRICSVAIPAILVTLIVDYIGLTFGSHPTFYLVDAYNMHSTVLQVLGSALFLNEIWNNHIVVGTLTPYWSLGFEVWYYVLWGVMLFVRPGLRIPAVVAALVFAGPKIVVLFPIWLFGVGCFFLVRLGVPRIDTRVRCALGVILTIGSFVAYFAIHQPYAGGCLYCSVSFERQALVSYAYNYAVGLIFAVNIIGFNLMAPLCRAVIRFEAPIRWCAGATFTLYLMHLPILVCIMSIMPFDRTTTFASLFVAAVTIGAVLALAEITERRKRIWIRFFRSLPLLRESKPQLAGS